MKKRKTAVLLAAVLCLELWSGGAVKNGRQKSLVFASAAEQTDLAPDQSEVFCDPPEQEQVRSGDATDTLIITETERPPEAETEFKQEENPEPDQSAETEVLSGNALDGLADGEIILDVEEVPEPESLEGEPELSETELQPEEVTSHSGRAEDGEGMARTLVRTVYSGSYGNQLSGQAAQLYGLMKKNLLQNGKKDSFTMKLDGFTFPVYPQMMSGGKTNWNLESNEIYLYSIKPEIAAMVQAAYDAFVYDYPEVFWLGDIRYGTLISLKKEAGNVEGTGVVTQITLTPEEEYSGAWSERASFQKVAASWKNAVQKAFQDGASQEEKVQVIHDYVCAQLSYDHTSGSQWNWSAGGALLHGGSVVCEGYAKIFKILCGSFGIESVLVSGKAKNGGSWQDHMWNYVCMENGKWYLVDVTWDDPDKAGEDARRTYFLRGSSGVGADGTTQIGMERMIDSSFSRADSQIFAQPELAARDYAEDDGTTHRHEWEIESELKPTCEQNGRVYYSCSGCDATKIEYVNPTGHKFTVFVSNHDETCVKDGTKTAVCDYCKTKTSTLRNVNSKKGHSYKYVYNKNATVFRNGSRTGTCIRCGRQITVLAPGTKLTPTIKINVSSVRLRVGQVTSAVKVSGLAAGDGVRSWVSENPSIVKVDRTTGKLTAGTKTGTAAVTVTLRSRLKKTIQVTVQKTAIRTTKLTGLPSTVTVAKGKTVKLTPVRIPVTSREKVTYAIGNRTVASAASNGVIKGLKKGKTNLTVRSGTKSVKVRIIVKG